MRSFDYAWEFPIANRAGRGILSAYSEQVLRSCDNEKTEIPGTAIKGSSAAVVALSNVTIGGTVGPRNKNDGGDLSLSRDKVSNLSP